MKRFAIYYTEGNHPDEFRELVIANSFAQANEKFTDLMHYSGGTAEIRISYIRVEY